MKAFVIGAAIGLVYFVFFSSDKSVDYYLSHDQRRIEKLQECAGADMTKDSECKNAYTAHRLWISSRR